MGWGIAMDYLKTEGMSPTKTVKLSQGIACFGSAVFIIILELHKRDSLWYYSNDYVYVNLILLFLLGIFLSISSSGYLTALASIAPSYTGFIASAVFVLEIIGEYVSSLIISHLYDMVGPFINYIFLKYIFRIHQEK